MRDVWKCLPMEPGAQSVMTFGVFLMPELPVGSLAIPQVCKLKHVGIICTCFQPQPPVLLRLPPTDKELEPFSWTTSCVLALRPPYSTAPVMEWVSTTVVTQRMLEPCVQVRNYCCVVKGQTLVSVKHVFKWLRLDFMQSH